MAIKSKDVTKGVNRADWPVFQAGWQIYCDTCGDVSNFSDSFNRVEVIIRLANVGWTVRQQQGESRFQAVCPDCSVEFETGVKK
jgi:hypothetical protein